MDSKALRSAVRPLVTTGFSLAQVGMAAAWMWLGKDWASDAFAALSPFTMATLIYWYRDRTEYGPDDSE